MKNKRGQTIFIGIIIGVMVFLAGMIALNFIKSSVTIARSSTDGLDCANASGITDGTKLACLIADSVVPYYIILIFSTTAAIILTRLLR